MLRGSIFGIVDHPKLCFWHSPFSLKWRFHSRENVAGRSYRGGGGASYIPKNEFWKKKKKFNVTHARAI